MSDTCAEPFTVILVKLVQKKKKLWLNKRVGPSWDGIRPEVPKALELLHQPILAYGVQVLTYTNSYVDSIRSEDGYLDKISGF